MSPEARSLARVAGYEVRLGKAANAKLGVKRHPSLLLTYSRGRAAVAGKVLRSFMPDMQAKAIEEVTCADERLTALRITLPGASQKYIDEVINFLNDPTLNQLFHAGDWEALHQDEDDATTRTILCRSGFTPPHAVMLLLDPKIQYRAIRHGIIRIISNLDTSILLTRQRQINAAVQTV